jgi:hypothetical protein
MGVVKSKKGVQSHPPSAADQADALALDRAVQTMIEGPLSNWDHTRPIGSLNRDDLRKLAIACLTGWVLQRAASGCLADTTEEDLTFAAAFAG